MGRRFLMPVAVVLLVTGLVTLASLAGGKSSPGSTTGSQGSHTITVTQWGPDQTVVDETRKRLLKNPALLAFIKGKRFRILSFDFVESGVKEAEPEPPSRFRATLFDYPGNRAIIATGQFKESAIEVALSPDQPLPSPDEFDEAVQILSNDPLFGPAIRDGSLQPYPPMPPLIDIGLTTDKVERTLTVGLLPKSERWKNEVVGVNMIRESVIRYDGGAPAASNAVAVNCGVPSAGQSTAGNGTAGQFQVVISRGAETIWSFLLVRPSASSGNNKSGIELRNVTYRGKLVLSRANAPVLNVQYYRNLCGPYRDWSWQEGKFAASGSLVMADPTPSDGGQSGIMLCTSEPETMIDNGTDTGNFRGVAIYDREEVTLVSELNAGWYRYITKWIFHDQGIISPRFGFGATINSCVCNGHVHHVYWRFDFDVVTAANNYVAEGSNGHFKTIETEAMRPRLGGDQGWLVRNSVTGESVLIRPGPLDGNYDKFGEGDVWLLRSQFPNEIDDFGQPGGACGSTCAHLDPMVNGESILNQDIVVWYAAHWVHDHFDAAPSHADGPAVGGPDLILQKY